MQQEQEQELKPAVLLATLLLLSMAAVPAIAAPISGSWIIDARDKEELVDLILRRSWNKGGSKGAWSHSTDIAPSELRGFRKTDGPVSISIVREAGTLRLDGEMDHGRASGQFTFEADPTFAADLTRAGFGDATDEDLLRCCTHDVGRDWFRNFQSLGLRELTLDGLFRLSAHGVKPEFVRALSAAGYATLEVDDVVRLQVHGVSVDYVRGLGSSSGKKPTTDEIVRYKVHGLEPSYVSSLSRWFDPEEMVRLHLHGVSADYVREFRSMGYQSASVDDLVRLRNHGVSPAFARRAQELHGRVTTEELIKLKVNGIE